MKCRMIALSLVGGLAVSTMGCSYNRAPVVDMTKVDPQQYQADREYCESYAEQLDKQEYAKTEGINGAVSGALVGGVAGAIDEGLEGALIGAAIGSAIGAGAGALGGANDATKQQALVLRNCLEQKGYKVYDKE